MRLTVLLIMMFMLWGCSAMLVGGSAEHERSGDCTQSEKEAGKDGC